MIKLELELNPMEFQALLSALLAEQEDILSDPDYSFANTNKYTLDLAVATETVLNKLTSVNPLWLTHTGESEIPIQISTEIREFVREERARRGYEEANKEQT